jgi:threonine dehydratase
MLEPPDPPVTIDDVRVAATRIRDRVHRTPILSSATLGDRAGARVLLKAELFQRTGSFKVRGSFNKVDSLTEDERRRGVISISAGNHAQAIAYACGRAGIDCMVVMWRSASPLKVEATRGYGATVDADSADPDEAYARLDALLAETGRVLVHPFDDPAVIAGQGTLGLELCEQVPDVDAVLVSTSGGGLLSGVATAVKAIRPSARVISVQAAATASLRAALDAGGSVRIEQRPTIADALTAPYLGHHCFEICRELVDEVVLLEEEELAEGFRFLYTRGKLACEVAGAAPAAALLAGKVDVRGATAVAVVSGGNVASDAAARLLAAG